MVATDSIRYDGAAFPVLLPDQAHKHLGVRMTLTGDFSQEKARVTDEMRLRLSALRTDKMLPPILKAVAIKIVVICVPVQRWFGPRVKDRAGPHLQVVGCSI